MTDDNAIEAALDAWNAPKVRGDTEYEDDPEGMRAALAAADKVRAEWFDADGIASELQLRCSELFSFSEEGQQQERDLLSRALRRAFAAGLAKGEAERAVLVEALKPFAWFASLLPKSVPDYMPLKADLTGSGDLTVAHLRAAALSLVRKGV